MFWCAERFAALLPKAKRERIGHAIIEGFKKKDFDGGLLNGVQAIEHALEGALGRTQGG